MKTWSKPIVEELNINETAHNWLGRYSDGGYIGDGILSGHSTNKKPEGSGSGSNSESGSGDSDSLS